MTTITPGPSHPSTTRRRAVAGLALITAGCLTGTYALDDSDRVLEGTKDEGYGFALSHFGGTGDEAIVAVGAPIADRVYLFTDMEKAPHITNPYLPEGWEDLDDATVFQGVSGDESGWSLASGYLVGDDAVLDLVIGAPSGASGKGLVYILDGNSAGSEDLDTSDVSVTFTGVKETDYLGWDVAIGDFDDDGHADLAMGAAGADDETGTVYVAYGPFGAQAEISASDLLALQSPDDNNMWMGAALTAGDLDADGQDELIIGTVEGSDPDDPDLVRSGRTYVLYELPEDDADVSTLGDMAVITSSIVNHSVGFSIDARGDVNGDGGDDLVLGAPNYYCYRSLARLQDVCRNADIVTAAYLVLGAAKRLDGVVYVEDIAAATATSTSHNVGFGMSVSNGGDLDNDGYDDVIIGAPHSHTAYVFYGDDSLDADEPMDLEDTDAPLVLTDDGEDGDDRYAGGSVYLSGLDVAQDGTSDLLVAGMGTEWVYEDATGFARAWLLMGEE